MPADDSDCGTIDCQGGVKPTTEVCNAKDDDCDGQIDNGIAIGNIPALAHVPGSSGSTRIEFLDYDNFRTTDNGITWSVAPTPLSCGNVCAIAFARLSPQRVWMLEGSG